MAVKASRASLPQWLNGGRLHSAPAAYWGLARGWALKATIDETGDPHRCRDDANGGGWP